MSLFTLIIFLILFWSHSSPVCSQAVTIYTPPSSYKIPRVLYARTLLTSDGTILATWENYGPEPPYFPVYQSTDKGRTWTELSRVKDVKNGWGLRYQPFLYELPEPMGKWPTGTILMAGSSIPSNLMVTQLELYASTDKGITWQFVSHIAKGGEGKPVNGKTPVWEPFLMVHNHKLIYYYSDQRDPRYGQKLVHQESSNDLDNWGDPRGINDVTQAPFASRPGMTTIATVPNSKLYILTFEWCNAPDGGGCPVHYRLSDDPLKFDNKQSHLLQTVDGTISGSPYVVYTPAGNGTLALSCSGKSEVYLHHGATRGDMLMGAWTKKGVQGGRSYTRSLMVMEDKKDILVVGAGPMGGSNNKVVAATIDVTSR